MAEGNKDTRKLFPMSDVDEIVYKSDMRELADKVIADIPKMRGLLVVVVMEEGVTWISQQGRFTNLEMRGLCGMIDEYLEEFIAPLRPGKEDGDGEEGET